LEQLRKLIVNLQTIARDAGHERPLLFGIDQENGTSILTFHKNVLADSISQGWYQLSAQRRIKRLEHNCKGGCAGFVWNYLDAIPGNSPGAMALAATGSTDAARQVSEATAAELHAIGINWVYSPVADVNTDSRNPVIGKYSFVIPFVLANLSHQVFALSVTVRSILLSITSFSV
jgi:beta-N-acetylhexosaminidase